MRQIKKAGLDDEVFQARGYAICAGGGRKIYPSDLLRCIRQAKKHIHYAGGAAPAFEYGIAFDASAIAGFGDETRSDLLLHPESETLMPLPWRPEHGKVVRMFTRISYPTAGPLNVIPEAC